MAETKRKSESVSEEAESVGTEAQADGPSTKRLKASEEDHESTTTASGDAADAAPAPPSFSFSAASASAGRAVSFGSFANTGGKSWLDMAADSKVSAKPVPAFSFSSPPGISFAALGSSDKVQPTWNSKTSFMGGTTAFSVSSEAAGKSPAEDNGAAAGNSTETSGTEDPSATASEPEAPISNGEENEDLVFQVSRAKLYLLVKKQPRPGAQTSPGGKGEAAEAQPEPASKLSGGSEETAGPSSEADGGSGVDGTKPSQQEAEQNARVLQNEWLERGKGTLRLLVTKEGQAEGTAERLARLVMRREKTETLILNVLLKGLPSNALAVQGDKAVRFICMDNPPDGKSKARSREGNGQSRDGDPSTAEAEDAEKPLPMRPCTYLLRMGSKEEASGLVTAAKDYTMDK